jgi:hypothetical protein
VAPGMVVRGTAGEFTSAKKCWECLRERARSLGLSGDERIDASSFRRPTRAYEELTSCTHASSVKRASAECTGASYGLGCNDQEGL